MRASPGSASGLALRCGQAGSRKFVFYYRQGGAQLRHTIGAANALTLDEARKRARRLRVAVDDGENPAAEKASKRAASALLFSTVMHDYLEARRPGMKPRSHEECSRHLTKHWKPLHGLAVGSDRPRHGRWQIAGDRQGKRRRSPLIEPAAPCRPCSPGPSGRGLPRANPVNGTNKASESKSRERVLSDAELVAIWKAAPDNDYGRIVKLLMLTAQRREEIGGLAWSEIDQRPKADRVATRAHQEQPAA